MRNLYIITAGILAVVAIVFFTHKTRKNGATVAKDETFMPLDPNDEIDAVILAQDGPDVHPEWVKARRLEIADELARDKGEMRKHGRVLTDEERSIQWWKEQDKAAERAAYAKLYAERKEWIDIFPFQPRYHQNLVYDPENIAHNGKKYRAYREELTKKIREAHDKYEAKTHEIWSSGGEMTSDEKHAACNKLYLELQAAEEPDPEIEAERRIIKRHKQLAGFYAQKYRYFPEFEQAYRIFEEEGAGDNPIRIANTMIALESYKVASKHDPDELHPTQTRIVEPQNQYQGQIHFQSEHGIIGTQEGMPERKPPQRRRITWKKEMESAYRCIAGNMASQRNLIPGEENLTEEQINRIRDRLVAEIPADNFSADNRRFWVGLRDPDDDELVPGQSLLAE